MSRDLKESIKHIHLTNENIYKLYSIKNVSVNDMNSLIQQLREKPVLRVDKMSIWTFLDKNGFITKDHYTYDKKTIVRYFGSININKCFEEAFNNDVMETCEHIVYYYKNLHLKNLKITNNHDEKIKWLNKNKLLNNVSLSGIFINAICYADIETVEWLSSFTNKPENNVIDIMIEKSVSTGNFHFVEKIKNIWPSYYPSCIAFCNNTILDILNFFLIYPDVNVNISKTICNYLFFNNGEIRTLHFLMRNFKCFYYEDELKHCYRKAFQILDHDLILFMNEKIMHNIDWKSLTNVA